MNARADETWMVGDNLETDIAGAQACGLYPVWHDHARSGLPSNAAVVPQRVIQHVAELLPSSESVG